MQSCAECGHLSTDDANFCDQCGSRLRPEPPPPRVVDTGPTEPERGFGGPWWVWALGAVALVAAVGAGAVLVLNDPDAATGSAEPTADPDPTAEATPQPTAPDPDDVLAADGASRVRLTVSNCPGCEITAVPADGSSAQVATVAGSGVEFAVPTASTLGLAFTVAHPDGFGSADGPNVIVLAPEGAAPGQPVTVADVIDADRVGVCWAGTLAEERSLGIAVEVFADGTRPGGLRAWADPAEPVTGAGTTPGSDGSVQAPAAAACASAVDPAG